MIYDWCCKTISLYRMAHGCLVTFMFHVDSDLCLASSVKNRLNPISSPPEATRVFLQRTIEKRQLKWKKKKKETPPQIKPQKKPLWNRQKSGEIISGLANMASKHTFEFGRRTLFPRGAWRLTMHGESKFTGEFPSFSLDLWRALIVLLLLLFFSLMHCHQLIWLTL